YVHLYFSIGGVTTVSFYVFMHIYLFIFFFFSSRRRHTRSVSAFLLNRSSDLYGKHQSFQATAGFRDYAPNAYSSRLSLSKHLAHNLGNLLLLGKIGVFHNRRNASSRLLLLISKHLIDRKSVV